MEGECDSDITPHDLPQSKPTLDFSLHPSRSTFRFIIPSRQQDLDPPLLTTEECNMELVRNEGTTLSLYHSRPKQNRLRRTLAWMRNYASYFPLTPDYPYSSNTYNTSFKHSYNSSEASAVITPLSLTSDTRSNPPPPSRPSSAGSNEVQAFLQKCCSDFTDPVALKQYTQLLRENDSLLPSELVTASFVSKVKDCLVEFSNTLSNNYSVPGTLSISQKQFLTELLKRINKFFLSNSRRYESALAFVRALWPFWLYVSQISDKAICDAVSANFNTISKFYSINVSKRVGEYVQAMKALESAQKEQEATPDGSGESAGKSDEAHLVTIPSIDNIISSLPSHSLLRRLSDITFKVTLLQPASCKLVCQLLTICNDLVSYHPELRLLIQGSVTFESLQSLSLSVESVKIASYTSSKVFLLQAQRVYRKYGDDISAETDLDDLTLLLHDYYIRVIRSLTDDETTNLDYLSSTARSPSSCMPKENKPDETITDMFYKRGKEVDKAVLNAINLLKERARDDAISSALSGSDGSSDEDDAAVAAELARLMAAPPPETESNTDGSATTSTNISTDTSREENDCVSGYANEPDALLPNSLCTVVKPPVTEAMVIAEPVTEAAVAVTGDIIETQDSPAPLLSADRQSGMEDKLETDGFESDVYDIRQMRAISDTYVSDWLKHNFLEDPPSVSLEGRMRHMCIFLSSVSALLSGEKSEPTGTDSQSAQSLLECEEDMLSQAIERLSTLFIASMPLTGRPSDTDIAAIHGFLCIFSHCTGLGFVGELECINFDTFLQVLQHVDLYSGTIRSVSKYIQSMSMLQNEDIRESLVGYDKKIFEFILKKSRVLDDAYYLNAENPAPTRDTEASYQGFKIQNANTLSATVRDLQRLVEKQCNMTVCEFVSSCLIEHQCLNCIILDLIIRSQKDFSAFLIANPDQLLQILHVCKDKLLDGVPAKELVSENIDVTIGNRLSYFLLMLFIFSLLDADTIVRSMQPLLTPVATTEGTNLDASASEGDVARMEQQHVAPEPAHSISKFTLDNIVTLFCTYLQSICKHSQQYSTDRSITYALATINRQARSNVKTIRMPFELFRNKVEGNIYFVEGTNVAKLLTIITEPCYSGLFEKSYTLIPKLKVRSDAGGIARRLLTTGHVALTTMRTLNTDLYDRIKLMTRRERIDDLRYVDKAIPRVLLASLFLDRVSKARIPISASPLESLLMTLEYLVHKKLIAHLADPPDGDSALARDVFCFPAGVKTKVSSFIVSLFTLSKHPISMTLSYALFHWLELPATDLALFYNSLERIPNFSFINISTEKVAAALAAKDDPESLDIVDPHSAEQAPVSLLAQQGSSEIPAESQPQSEVPASNLVSSASADTLDQSLMQSPNDRLSVSLATQSTCTLQCQAQLTLEEYTSLAQLFYRSFTHVVVTMLFALGNWRCYQLGQFLYLPAERISQLQGKALSIPDRLTTLNSLSVILGEIEAIVAFIPLVQQTLPIVALLSGCLAHIDEAIFLGNEPIMRTLFRVLLPGDLYFSLIRPPSAQSGQIHSLTSSLATKPLSAGGSILPARPLSSSLTNKAGYFVPGSINNSRGGISVSLKTKQTVLTCLRSTLMSAIQSYAFSTGPPTYPFYNIYTNELLQFSQLEICSIYLIGWLRLTQSLTLCYDSTLVSQLITMLSYFPQLRYGNQRDIPEEATEPERVTSFNAFSSLTSNATPLMHTNSPALRPSSRASTTSKPALRGASGVSSSSLRSISGLFSPNFNVVSTPFIALLFPAFTFDGAVSNSVGWIIYHFLLSYVKSGGLEGMLHQVHIAEESVSLACVSEHATESRSGKYIDSLTSYFDAQIESISACKNICSLVSALVPVLQYDMLHLNDSSAQLGHKLPAHILQGMLMNLPETVCNTGEHSFDEPNSTSRMAKILIPLSAPLGAFSTAGCFAIDLPTTQASKTDSTEVDNEVERVDSKKKISEQEMGTKMVDIYISVSSKSGSSPETHFSYLSAESTLADAWTSYQVFLTSEYNDYFFLQSHAIIDPACLHGDHLGMLFALCSYNTWFRVLLDPLYRRSILVRCVDDKTDPYYALYSEVQQAHRCYCLEAGHLSGIWFGVDLIAITRILRDPDAEVDDADIAHRKQLCLLKRACIYITELKEVLRVKSVAEGSFSHLLAQQTAIKSVEENTILGLVQPASGIDGHTIAQILMEDLAAQSKPEYNSMMFLGALGDVYLNGAALFMLSFDDKLFMFRHIMRLSSNCYLPEQTMSETMVEATKYVPAQSTTLEISVRRDAPLQSLIEYLDQNIAGSQAALQKPWRVAFVDENALDLHGPRQEYMNLVTSDLMSHCQAFSRKNYLPKACKVGAGSVTRRQVGYLEYMVLAYLISRSITEFLSLSFDIPVTLLRRILGLPFKAQDIMLSSPEVYYGNLIALLNVDKSKFEDCVGLDITDVPFDDTIDTEHATIRCFGDAMDHVNMMVTEITAHRSAPINAVAKLVQRSLPSVDLRIFTPVELGLVISGINELPPNQLISLFKWVHPPSDTSSALVSQATELAFSNVINDLTHEERSEFLCFVTGSSRIPPIGFEPELKVQRLSADGETPETRPEDIDIKKLRLPSASTCFHSLKLPPYCSPTDLKRALKISISEGKTFEFA